MGGSYGVPCMNSGSATLPSTNGILARRARTSALISPSPRSRRYFFVVFTRRCDERTWPLTPTVLNTWVTSEIDRTCCSIFATASTLRSKDVPGGRSTMTWNSPRSSLGTNSVPRTARVLRLAANTTVATPSVCHGRSSAHPSTV